MNGKVKEIVVSFLKWLILVCQMAALSLASLLVGCGNRVRRRRRREYSKVVIGVSEIARNLHSLGRVFDSSITVGLTPNRYYRDSFDFGPYARWVRLFFGPLLLAYLSSRAETFIYLWSDGFLIDRESDFRFLKRKGKKIVLFFVGDDIRSPQKTKEVSIQRDEDSVVDYYPAIMRGEEYENQKRRIAETADRYADIILSNEYELIGYLTRKTHPVPYIIDLSECDCRFEKFVRMDVPHIIHAPTAPVFKGTQLVRAAIKKLQIEGYQFTYTELMDMPNEEVLKRLQASHIVLNQFYWLAPGTLGIEALATGNAVLMSATRVLNQELPPDCEGAWCVTRYWQVYDNLKYLLDHPNLIEQYAREGRKFVERNYDLNVIKAWFANLFLEHGIPM